MLAVDEAMRRSLGGSGGGLTKLIGRSLRSGLERERELDRRNVVDDIKTTLSSWGSCMDAAYCKWPVIAVMAVGGLVVVSIVVCIVRRFVCGRACCCSFFTCLRCCGNCFGCCDPPKGKRHKYLDDEPYIHAPSRDGYKPQPPMVLTRAVTSSGSSSSSSGSSRRMPAVSATATAAVAVAAAEPPQYAEFETKKHIDDDTLPSMPVWAESTTKLVPVDPRRDVEMNQLAKPEPQAGAVMSGGSGRATPVSARGPSPSADQRGPVGATAYGRPLDRPPTRERNYGPLNRRADRPYADPYADPYYLRGGSDERAYEYGGDLYEHQQRQQQRQQQEQQQQQQQQQHQQHQQYGPAALPPRRGTAADRGYGFGHDGGGYGGGGSGGGSGGSGYGLPERRASPARDTNPYAPREGPHELHGSDNHYDRRQDYSHEKEHGYGMQVDDGGHGGYDGYDGYDGYGGHGGHGMPLSRAPLPRRQYSSDSLRPLVEPGQMTRQFTAPPGAMTRDTRPPRLLQRQFTAPAAAPTAAPTAASPVSPSLQNNAGFDFTSGFSRPQTPRSTPPLQLQQQQQQSATLTPPPPPPPPPPGLVRQQHQPTTPGTPGMPGTPGTPGGGRGGSGSGPASNGSYTPYRPPASRSTSRDA